MNSEFRRIVRRLTADKKRFTLMVILLAVGLLLWGRLLLNSKVTKSSLADEKVASGKVDTGDMARAQATLNRPTVYVDLPRMVTRDLFALDPTKYASRAVEEAQKPVAEAADKTMGLTPEQAGLALQSTMLGDSPRALINGKFVTPGQRIEGFTLRQVMPRSVVLENEGQRFTLAMEH